MALNEKTRRLPGIDRLTTKPMETVVIHHMPLPTDPSRVILLGHPIGNDKKILQKVVSAYLDVAGGNVWVSPYRSGDTVSMDVPIAHVLTRRNNHLHRREEKLT